MSRTVSGWSRRGRIAAIVGVFVLASAIWLVFGRSDVRATSGGDPYAVPNVVDTNPDPHIVQTTLTAEKANVDVGGGVTAHAETFNGTIPGPTFHLHVGDTVIVHFVNHLDTPASIHWHGVEVPNDEDGTPFTQDMVQPGGDFLYKFTVERPGIFWYHPHGLKSTNQVFAGMYGMIVVTDPNEAALQRSGTLPPAAQTRPIVLSDTTVCKTAGSNDTATYNAALPWVGGGALPAQAPPVPKTLCEMAPAGGAIDQDGNPATADYAAGDVPAIQRTDGGRTNEGQTVLTNGKNVGGRAGSPSSPGTLDPGASTLNVRPGQGLRLELVNASTVRYMRLRLTTPTGTMVPLIRVGGEGGLLDNAVEEGNDPEPAPAGVFDSGYNLGEILLPPGSRADVVAAIPSSPTSGVLTMWTEDYKRTGMGFSDIPTVPVMHLNLSGSAQIPAYSISAGTPLRAATGDLVPVLGPPNGTVLDPSTFSPPKLGNATSAISFTQMAGNTIGINGVIGVHSDSGYMTAPHLGSTRYAKVGDTLELTTTNATGANHPFHLHGFSIQPISLSNGTLTYTWPYHEFRDNIDIPAGYTLTFRVRLDDRPLADGVTPGGALGRWMFHCHIFFHAELGMLSELVVVPSSSGKEKPDISVNSGNVQVDQGETATVGGSFADVDGEAVTLSSTVGTMHDDGGGSYTWSFNTGRSNSRFVYLTATNSDGTKSQVVFFLDIVNTSPPSLVVPGSKKGTVGKKLGFRIQAFDPDGVDLIALGAFGLPSGLKFTDNHHRTGTVSGTVLDRSGKYTATFTASDGHHPPVAKSVKITIKPGALATVIGRRVRLKNGSISVRCQVANGSIKNCSATALLNGKQVGSASGHHRKRGNRSITLNIKLSKAARQAISRARRGVTIAVHLAAHKFGSTSKLLAGASTTALKQH